MKKLDLNIDSRRMLKIALYIIYVGFVFAPFISMGVQCNDDLQWRLYSSQGLGVLAKHYWDAAVVQGRVLSVVQIISLYLSFFDHRILFGVVKALVMICNIILIAYLLREYISKRVAGIFTVIAPLLIPITFYYTPPTAFTMFVAFPFSWLLIALILFSSYLRTKQKYKLIVSLTLYFLSMCAYELFILYSPLFAMIAYQEMGHNLKDSVKSIRFHVITGFFYLGCYICVRALFPSNYAGNQLNFSSLQQSLGVWGMLVKSGLPGNYVFTGKGMYLLDLAINSPASKLDSIIKELVDVRVIVVTLLASVMLVKVLREYKDGSKGRLLAGALASLYCIFVPPVINAVSESWMTVDVKNDPQGSTVSYLITLSVVIMCALVLSVCIPKKQVKWANRLCSAGLIFAVAVYGMFIQSSNNAYSILGNNSSDRIERIENLLDTYTVRVQNADNIYAPEACSTYLMQSAPENYWLNYAFYHETPSLSQTNLNQPIYLNMIDDGKAWLMGVNTIWENETAYSNQLYLFSEDSLQGKCVNFADENMQMIQHVCGSPYKDGKYFVEQINLDEYVLLESIAIVR